MKHAALKVARVFCVALIAQAAYAEDVATPPTPAAPRALRITTPRETKLANGLRVIVAERHGLPIVTAQLLVLSGNEIDPINKSGLASITAGLLTKGTQHHDATEIANAAEALGGTLQTSAGWDRSTIAMTVTSPKLDDALALIGEVVTEPAFKDEELDRLRTRSIDGLKVAYANPGTLASLIATRMLFGSGAYGNPPAGTPTSLTHIDRDDVVALYRARYRPDNVVLILVGDIDLAHARTIAQRRFGRWRASKDEVSASPVTRGTASEQALTVLDMGSTGQAAVVLALPLTKGGDANERAAGEVTNAVLGGGFSSRLNQEIRVKRGLSYGARTSLDERRDGGLVLATVQTKNESAAEVMTLVETEFDHMADTPVPADELSARKATLIGDFARSVETTSGLSQQIAASAAKGMPLSELPMRIDRYSAVGDDAVQRYARQHYANAMRRVAVAGNASQFEAALKTTTPDLVSIKQGALDLDH
jgi:zinc protease